MLIEDSSAAVWGFDIETTPQSPYDGGRILTAALSDGDVSYAWGIDHPESTDERDAVIAEVQKILGDETKTIVGHAVGTFDVQYWEAITGKVVTAQLFDTQVAYGLIDDNAETNSLAFLATKYLDEEEKGDLDRKKLAEYDIDEVLEYNAQDAMLSWALYGPLLSELQSLGLMPTFELSMQLVRELVTMMKLGVRIDAEWIDRNVAELEEKKEALGAQIAERIGSEVNLRSPKQLRTLLFEELRLQPAEFTKGGEPSTSHDAVAALKRSRIPKEVKKLLDDILRYREYEKYIGTYLKPYKEKHATQDGRIHAQFHVARGFGGGRNYGTRTGRLSSSRPNLQNLPRSSIVRGAIIPDERRLLFSADYAQLEMFIAAWYADEQKMLRAVDEGWDLHTKVLADIEERKYEEVEQLIKESSTWQEKRVQIKRVNFGILYGASGYRISKIAQDLGVSLSVKKASEWVARWFETYSKITKRIEAWKDEIIQTGRIRSASGAYRTLPGASRYDAAGQGQLRKGVNFPIQELAARVTFAAIVVVAGNSRRDNNDLDLLFSVHDSLVGEYSRDYRDEDVQEYIKQLMEEDTNEYMMRIFNLDKPLPLRVDVDVGLQRWK